MAAWSTARGGGTGRWAYERPPPNPPFPACCDPDGDGFGTLKPAGGFPGDFFLQHGARSDQVGTGDVLIERVTTNGVETQYAAALGFVFGTAPALVSYSDRPGTSVAVTYPVASGGAGTPENGFPVRDGPDADSDVEVTFTSWRPQRRPIEGEACLSEPAPCQWVDIGHATYSVGINCVESVPDPAGCALKGCPASTLSTSDPHLRRAPEIGQPEELPVTKAGAFTDLADDQAAKPANTISYTLNVSKCVDAYSSLGITFKPGEELEFFFIAGGGAGGISDFAQQIVYLKRQ